MKQPRRRGFGLIVVLQFAALFASLLLLFNLQINHARSKVETHKRTRAAKVMAESGLEYARYQLKEGNWLTARRFVSPSFGQGHHFEVEVVPLGKSRWKVTSVGRVGPNEVRLERNLP